MADDSGLGKTIKSGLIAHELRIQNGRGEDRGCGTHNGSPDRLRHNRVEPFKFSPRLAT